MNKAISVGRLTRDLEVKVRYSEPAAKDSRGLMWRAREGAGGIDGEDKESGWI